MTTMTTKVNGMMTARTATATVGVTASVTSHPPHQRSNDNKLVEN